jgi:hypothetical protein
MDLTKSTGISGFKKSQLRRWLFFLKRHPVPVSPGALRGNKTQRSIIYPWSPASEVKVLKVPAMEKHLIADGSDGVGSTRNPERKTGADQRPFHSRQYPGSFTTPVPATS